MKDFTVDALPDAGGFPRWKDELYLRIVTASNRPDHKAMEWVAQAEQVDTVAESELANSGPLFEQLDYILADKLRSVVKHDLKRLVQHYTEHLMRTERPQRPPKGRELLRIIVNYYATSESAVAVVSLMDFVSLKLRGKELSHLERYCSSWQSLLSQMTRPLDNKVLEEILYDNIKGFPGLAYEIHHYNCLREDHEDKSYRFLWNMCKTHLRREQQIKNKEDTSRHNRAVHSGLRTPSASSPAAPGAAGEEAEGDLRPECIIRFHRDVSSLFLVCCSLFRCDLHVFQRNRYDLSSWSSRIRL